MKTDKNDKVEYQVWYFLSLIFTLFELKKKSLLCLNSKHYWTGMVIKEKSHFSLWQTYTVTQYKCIHFVWDYISETNRQKWKLLS